MLIRCPTCSSGYDLAPELLNDGRILRCAHCRDAWVHRADLPDGPAIAAAASFMPAADLPPESPRRRRLPRPAFRFRRPAFRVPAGAAAALLLAALIGGGFSAVAGKERVVAAFPPSEAVFATMGLPVNLSGLGLKEIRSTVTSGDGPSTLLLEGDITNLRPVTTAVPALRIAVRDKSRRELYYWTAPAPRAQLASGETVRFRSRLTAPPRDGQEVAVSFAEAAPTPRRLAEVLPGDR